MELSNKYQKVIYLITLHNWVKNNISVSDYSKDFVLFKVLSIRFRNDTGLIVSNRSLGIDIRRMFPELDLSHRSRVIRIKNNLYRGFKGLDFNE